MESMSFHFWKTVSCTHRRPRPSLSWGEACSGWRATVELCNMVGMNCVGSWGAFPWPSWKHPQLHKITGYYFQEGLQHLRLHLRKSILAEVRGPVQTQRTMIWSLDTWPFRPMVFPRHHFRQVTWFLYFIWQQKYPSILRQTMRLVLLTS